jgi:hypothetical protein
MAKVIGIRFIRNCSPYNEGDVAGFGADIAEKYVQGGLACYATVEVKQSPVAKVPGQMSAPEPSPNPLSILASVTEEEPAKEKVKVKARSKKRRGRPRKRVE